MKQGADGVHEAMKQARVRVWVKVKEQVSQSRLALWKQWFRDEGYLVATGYCMTYSHLRIFRVERLP